MREINCVVIIVFHLALLPCSASSETKSDWHAGLDSSFQGDDDPNTVFEIDQSEYITFSKTIQDTEVLVAVHSEFADLTEISGFSVPTPKVFADRVFKTFTHHCNVFGGYPYNRYTVKVKPFSGTIGFSLSKVGIALGKTAGTPSSDYPPHGYVEALEGFVQHEMFHSWLGKLIQYEPDGSGNLFQPETWLVEGGASYYGDRSAGFAVKRSIYKKLMMQKLTAYTNSLGTSLDLSIVDIAKSIGAGPPENNEAQTILYAKSALVNYLLDGSMRAYKLNLDVLMKRLYTDYGLTGKKFTQSDVVRILNDETKVEFSSFFNDYLFGNKGFQIKKIKLLVHKSH